MSDFIKNFGTAFGAKNLTAAQRIGLVLRSFIPTSRITVMNPWTEQQSIANRLTASDLFDFIESAKGGDPRDLWAVYRDILVSSSHLQSEFNKRKLAILGDALAVKPRDKKNADDVQAAAAVRLAIDNYRAPNPGDLSSCPWLRFCSHLLDSILWPVAVGEKVFKPSSLPGLRYEIGELVIVPENLITYQSGPQDLTGLLKIRDLDRNGYIVGTNQIFDPARYVVHRGHLLSVHDTWGGPMRSLLFWWLLANMDRDWWARFLERFGSPFLVGKYEQGDDDSRSIMERAFSMAVKIGGLVVSRQTEVEIMQAASQQTGEAYEKFIDLANKEMSKLVVGQTLSSGQRSGSFGDAGRARNEEGVRQDIRVFDAMMLGQTLEDQLFAQFLKINGLAGRVKLIWGGESSEDATALGTLLSNLSQAGLQLTDDALDTLSERLGFAVQRSQAPAGPLLGLSSLSTVLEAHDAQDDIARAGAAELARAFRGSLAPIRKLIALSKSPADLENGIRSFYADYDARRQARLIEEALIAFAANGASRTA